MLIDFSIENFRSIKDKITFSLETVGGMKRLSKNITKSSPPLIKSAVIYGANASGKSNLIKGLFFIWQMVATSYGFNAYSKIPRIPYKFDKNSIKNPSKFEINFIHNNIKYRYGFSCTEEKITEEYLYYSPKGKESLIFKRDKKNQFVFKPDIPKQKLFEKQTTPNVLYVSRATQLGYEKTKEVFEFFLNSLIININPTWRQYTLKNAYENPELRREITNILQKSDFGGISEILIKKEREDNIYDIKFIHNVNDRKISLDSSEESAGTQKTLDMLGPLLDILEKGHIAIIDELETSLHPEIARFIIKLFSSKHNKKNAQLIFSTHNVALLDSELFRKDQVYFCEKELNKTTKLISLSEFDIRQDANFEKAYREGRLGAVPFIDKTYMD